MKLVKNRYFQLLIAFFALGAVFFAKPVFALEPNYELPSMLWGRASVTTKPGTSESMVYFSQPQATMAIRNTAPGTLPNFDYSVDCLLGITDTNISCFKFSQPSGTKVLNSKTYVNEVLKSAVAALKYPPVNVTGSTYSVSDLGDFAYWGRHLRQTGDNYSRNAFWQAMDYQFNLAAQAYWNLADPVKNSAMSETLNRLKSNASDLSNTNWSTASTVYNFNGVCGGGVADNCPEESLFPEGKFWLYHGDKISSELHYYSKGTIYIQNGDLNIISSIFNPKTGNEHDKASFGIVINNGDLIIRNLNPNEAIKISASIFVPNGTIKVIGDNITLTGSFVAKDFSVTGSNINFIQDTRGEDAWPPGFRDLQLPIILNK